MKKIISIFLIIALLISINLTAINADVISVYFNGERIVFDVDPEVIDGRTMVPMRAIFETFGANVEYNTQTKQITAQKSVLLITLTINSNIASINNNGNISEIILDSMPIIINGRTLVPLRFVGEALGSTVNWNGELRKITITSATTMSLATPPRTEILSATEIARFMAPRCVILEGFDASNNPINTGSGFFINDSGHIVTNYHVIEDTVKIVATLNDGTKYTTESVIHVDRKRDLVVLSINKKGTPFVIFGDSSKVEAGNTVYTYGSPKGIANMISDGIVSNSNVVIENYSYILVTAPISPGSSGGCLVDDKGNVIGITTISRIDAQNINGAIPVNDLKNLLNQNQLIYKSINYSNGTYNGYTLNGYRHYKGTYLWTSGNEYSGDWVMGERTGFGKFTWGPGEWYGHKYIGDFIKGERTGFGKYFWPDGDEYEGEFLNGDRHGIGRHTWSDGAQYYGEWEMNERTGYGIFTWPNGNEYYGNFMNGYFHGYGTIYFTNGTQKSGNWNMGTFIG